MRLRSPLCCLTSDTHSLSVLLLGHVTIPFSREQHNVSIVMEYPSRSNLNSFPEFYEASAERVMNSDSTQDCRHPLSGKNHYQYFIISKNIFSFLRGYGSPTYQHPHPRHLFYKVTKHFPFPQAPFLFFLHFRVWTCFTSEFGIFVVPVGFEPTTTCM